MPRPWNSTIDRRVGLRRGAPPQRTGRLRPINPERRARSRGGPPGSPERHIYGPYWIFASWLPCCVCGAVDGAPADHWKTVGSGGRDYGNCLPVCVAHNDRHELGRETWQGFYRVDAEAVCECVRQLWEERC